MIDNEKIERINHLAKKAKSKEGLSQEEKAERETLRKEYIKAMRENVKHQLKRVKFVEDLTEEELKELEKKKKES